MGSVHKPVKTEDIVSVSVSTVLKVRYAKQLHTKHRTSVITIIIYTCTQGIVMRTMNLIYIYICMYVSC